ncbi:MAG: hypothetical protein ACPGVB_05745 [Chitinophagales bacterium]
MKTNLLKLCIFLTLSVSSSSLYSQGWEVDILELIPYDANPSEAIYPTTFSSIDEVPSFSTEGFQKEKYKEKKSRLLPILIGGIVAMGTLSKVTSIKNYQTAKQYYNRGDTAEGHTFYKKSKQQHNVFLGFTGLAVGVNLANIFSVLKNKKKAMKKYSKN